MPRRGHLAVVGVLKTHEETVHMVRGLWAKNLPEKKRREKGVPLCLQTVDHEQGKTVSFHKYQEHPASRFQ